MSYDSYLEKLGIMDYGDYDSDYNSEVELEQKEKEDEEVEDPIAQLERIIEVESSKKVVQAKAKTESITPTLIEKKKEDMTLERILREITEKNAQKERNFEDFKARSLTKRDLKGLVKDQIKSKIVKKVVPHTMKSVFDKLNKSKYASKMLDKFRGKRDLDSEIEKLKELEPKKFPESVQGIFDEMCPLISVNGVKEVQGVFEYIITGKNTNSAKRLDFFFRQKF